MSYSVQGQAAAGRLRALTHDMSATFLQEYEGRIVGCPSYPADAAQAASLLNLFLLEKALYEVTYELANRPDWLDIPLASVLALLDLDASAGSESSLTSTFTGIAPISKALRAF